MALPTDLVTKTKQVLKPKRVPKEARVPFVPAEWAATDPERKPDGVTVRNVVIDNETGEVVEGAPLPGAANRELTEAQRAGTAADVAIRLAQDAKRRGEQ